ncbi:hypothetical protein ABW20_dc0106396 [Dactylellina cionopaga]|nr:hypothetical protein ABW20_dc0106396 [Dactylellina cionopaga]
MISSASSAIRRARSHHGLYPTRTPIIQTKCILATVPHNRRRFDSAAQAELAEQEPLSNPLAPPSPRDPSLPPEATRKQLLPILRLLGCADDIPLPRKGSTNLGYTNPQAPLNRALRRESLQKHNSADGSPRENRGISLAGLTARYILYKVWPDRQQLYDEGYPLRREFFALGLPAREYLRSRNADYSDLSLWAFVLLGRSGPEAISRLDWLCRKLRFRVPSFTVNHTLRHLSGHTTLTVRKITLLVDKYLTKNREMAEQLQKPDHRVDSVTKRIMFLRLFRLANYFAPTHLLLVAKVYAKHSIDSPAEISKNDVTFCNHIIWSISSPPRISNPYYTSLRYIIDAQVFLLKKMFQANPVMHLEPKGFRGIVRTRLASPRSPTERGIISQQGSNWPPWKEATDGYDESHSRVQSETEEMIVGDAGLFLKEMQRAGYPLGTWEKAAMVLSGREDDGAPTVLRRTWFIAGSSSGNDNPFTIWQARIRATRTLNEAWHIFLLFLNVPLTTMMEKVGAVHVFQEMFLKVLQARKQNWRKEYPSTQEVLTRPTPNFRRFVPGEELERIYAPTEPQPDPTDHYLRSGDTIVRGPTKPNYGPNFEDRATISIGDTKNLLEPPQDPARGAYIPTPPPSVDELWSIMVRRDVSPSLGLIKHLVSNSASASEAHRYLEAWYDPPTRRRFIRTEKGETVWEWWKVLHRKELEKLEIKQISLEELPKISVTESLHPEAKVSASATIDLAIAYIASLTSTTYAPSKSHRFDDHLLFAKKLLFGRVPHAIIVASSFGITSITAWTNILKALNYTRLHRGLFQSSWARTAVGRLSSAKFSEGNPHRRMKYRDVNLSVLKIWQHVRSIWGAYPQDMGFVYELVVAAEKGWEYEMNLLRHGNFGDEQVGAPHKPMPFRAADAVEIWESVVGIRELNTRSFRKHTGAKDFIRLRIRRVGAGEWAGEKAGVDPGDEAGEDENTESADARQEQELLFEKLVELSSPVQEEKSRLPPMVAVRTAHIHGYIRLLLKTGQDEFNPVLRLLKWMVHYSDFLEVRNRRLPIIALRALWNLYAGMDTRNLTKEDIEVVESRKTKFEEAKKLVGGGLKGWGGWASEAEVAAYNGENWRDLRDEGDVVEGKDDELWDEEGLEEGGEEGREVSVGYDEDDW